MIHYVLPFTLFSLYLFVKMQRKKASKGKSAGLSRLEKVVVPAQATANYRAPVTRRQGLQSTKVEVELGKILLLRNWVAAYSKTDHQLQRSQRMMFQMEILCLPRRN